VAKPRILKSRHYRYEGGKLVLKSEDPMKVVDASQLPPGLADRMRKRLEEAEQHLRELHARQARRRRKSA
jgi:hypothetical protein